MASDDARKFVVWWRSRFEKQTLLYSASNRCEEPAVTDRWSLNKRMHPTSTTDGDLIAPYTNSTRKLTLLAKRHYPLRLDHLERCALIKLLFLSRLIVIIIFPNITFIPHQLVLNIKRNRILVCLLHCRSLGRKITETRRPLDSYREK